MIRQILFVAAALGINLTPSELLADNFEIREQNDRLGRIYSYVRSNIDGSNRENVLVFRRDRKQIEVYKYRQRCHSAALVTAELDPALRSAASITGGKLLPGARHQEFAFLTYDKNASRIDFNVLMPEQTLSLELDIEDGPWHLFDFDLASLTVMTPHLAKVEDGFGFEMPLFWADAADNPARYLGHVDATHAGGEQLGDTATFRFDISGGVEGSIWLDAEDRHIVLATLDRPNHPGYKNFKLELMSVSDGGPEEWTGLLTAHYEGCN
jgi:hypothetical protein